MVKLKLTVTCLLLSMMLNAQSPYFQWAKSMGGSAGTQGKSIALDASGNEYITGNFSGTTDFDPGAGTFNLTSAGGDDIFVSKLDPSGNFLWAKQIGGISNEYGFSVGTDASGNAYITGYFNGTADFDPGVGTFNLTSVGQEDIFILKLDASGNFVWAKKIGGVSADQAHSISVNSTGVYTTGIFRQTVDFDPGAGTFNLTDANSSSGDIFVSKLDASGNFVWAKKMGGTNTEDGWAIAADASGNVYTTGYFVATVDFNPGSPVFNLTAAVNQDVFISKLDVSGNFVWAKQLGGSTFNFGRSIAVDVSGNVYTTGRFTGTSDFDPGAGTFNLTSAGGNDIFVSKLNSSGNLIWAKRMGGTNWDEGISIAVDTSGNVYTTGSFYTTVDFDPGAGTFNLTPLADDAFISKLDASGNFVWAGQLGGNLGQYGTAIITDVPGNVYTAGYFNGTADFDPGAGIFNLSAGGSPGAFVHKMGLCPLATISPGGPTTFCSGGSVVLNANTGTGYQWQKDGINISGATLLNYSATLAGNYTVIVTSSCGSATSSPVTVTVNPVPSASITAGGPLTFCPGDSVILSANSGAGFTWQWKSNGSNISGATLQTYAANQTGSYTAAVTTAQNCSALSNAINVSVMAISPSVSANGTTSLCYDDTVTLSAATGAGYIYQWKKDGINISGATLSSYTVYGTFGAGGSYTCQVTSGTCSTTSNSIAVTYNTGGGLPVITITTSSNVICSSYLIITAPSGYTRYKWYRNGIVVSITTGNTYNAMQGGSYTCRAFGANCSNAPSNTLILYSPNAIVLVNSSSGCNLSGWNAQLNADNVPPGALFQWQRYGVDIYNERNSYLLINEPGDYSCVVSTNCGANLSNTITLSGPASVSALGSTSFCTGGVDLKATPNATSYQWNLNGGSIPGATSQLYHANSSGSYTCTLNTAACGTGTSNTITVQSNIPPQNPVLSFSSLVPAPSYPWVYNICSTPPVNVIVSPPGDFGHTWFINNVPTFYTSASIPANIPGDYYCQVNYSCGSSYSNLIVVHNLPATNIPLFYSSPTGCNNVLLSAGSGWSSYQWKLNGISINGETSPIYFALSSGNYSCLVSNGCNSQESSPVAITVNNIISPTITPSGSTTFCTGGSVLLNANTGTGYTYQWYRSGISLSGATSSSYTAAVAGNYTVIIINACGTYISPPVAVTTIPLPTASITPAGVTTFCSGGNVILNANTGTGLSYQWKNGGTDISGATGSSYNATTSGSYTVVVTNTCGSATSSLVTVTVNPLPTVSFSGLASSYNVSAGAATLTGSPAGGTFSGPGISGNTFTPSVAGVGGPYTITYSYTDVNGCSNNSSQQTTVTSCTVPAQPGTITVTGGSAKVCPGDTRTYTIVAVSGATSYTWTPPAGATIASGQGNASVSINYTAGFTASGTLSVVANSACGSSIAKTLTVSRNNPATPSVISGASSAVCAATSGAYSVTNVAGMTYNWTAPANASISSGQGTNSVIVSFTASWISGSLSVTATNNCGTSAARTLSILSKPATPSTITGASNTVCAGTTGNYSVTNVPGVTYNWTAPANASVVSGQGTNSVSVNFSVLFTSGPLTVSGSNACGTSALRTLSISSTPAKPGTITGSAYGNCNAVAAYSIAAVAYATSYTWSTNIPGAIVTPNGISASIAFPTFTSGIVSVTANNSCGSSIVRTLTVKGTPATPASITGPALVCANQFGVPYSIAAIPTATSYIWTGMTGSHISDGVVTSSGTTLTTTSTSVTVNFGNTSGNLSVKANNPCGLGSSKTLAIGFNCREGEMLSENDFDVMVFPNPSSGDFVFSVSNVQNAKISINIYDMIGKLVLSKDFHDSQFVIADPLLIPGSYFAEVVWQENKEVIKLVKVK